MARVLILGSTGQLGSRLLQCAPAGCTAVPAARADADISSAAEIERLLGRVNPAVVINAAAWTDVAGAEGNPGEAFAVNAAAPGVIARWCSRNGARMVHFGTDYVFDGTGREPYTEEDIPRPVNVYGKSKWAGEEAALAEGATVLRVSWLHGSPGRGFVPEAARALLNGAVFRVRADQEGSPTEVSFLARMVRRVIRAGIPPGLFHVASSGYCSRLEEAMFVRSELAGLELPVTGSVEYCPQEAASLRVARPLNCRLDCGRFARRFEVRPESWQEGLRRTVQNCADEAGRRSR